MGLISARLFPFPDFHGRSPSWRVRSSRFWSLLSSVVSSCLLQGAPALSPLSSLLSEGPLLGPDLGPGRAPLLRGLLCQISLAFLSYSVVLNTHPCCAATACPWCAPRAAAEPHAEEGASRPESIRGSQKTRLCELGLGRACRLASRPVSADRP